MPTYVLLEIPTGHLLANTQLQGTFQDYYETTLLPSSSSATVSLIGSLQVFFLYGFGPLTGRIFDAYGSRVGSFIRISPDIVHSSRSHAGPHTTRLVVVRHCHDDDFACPDGQGVPALSLSRCIVWHWHRTHVCTFNFLLSKSTDHIIVAGSTRPWRS